MKRDGWMMIFVAMLHTWWGVTILIAGPQGSDWHGGVAWNVFVNYGGIRLWSWFFVIASILALYAIWRGRHLYSFIALVPQQVVVTVSAVGIFLALIGQGHDYEFSRIMRVAAYSIPMFICHSLELLEFYGYDVWKRLRSPLSR